MKSLIISISVLIVFSFSSLAQRHDPPSGRMPEKLRQLEKIKLIETLEMDEETTLKFFSRRTEHRNDVDQLHEELEGVLIQIESVLSGEQEASEEELKTLIEHANKTDNEISLSKSKFIHSLGDLLSTRQIAKLIVFERRFRDELRDVLFRERKFRKKF